ncbi:MAG: hypothetical protein QOE20_4708 [Mycobacterium sp.]|jgi:hypothetical protein|nr:hypothetical protein [Mycobacterium sp.]
MIPMSTDRGMRRNPAVNPRTGHRHCSRPSPDRRRAGTAIITERVENAHQHAAVESLGYRLAQGFYGRPQTCAEIVDTIPRGTSRAITPAE